MVNEQMIDEFEDAPSLTVDTLEPIVDLSVDRIKRLVRLLNRSKVYLTLNPSLLRDVELELNSI